MTTWIALLRGINVGGRNKLPMKALCTALEIIGLSEIRTYIQSGNVVFTCAKSTPDALGNKISNVIEKQFGFRPFVLVLSEKDFRAAVSNNPFALADASGKTLHLSFLKDRPGDFDKGALNAAKAPSEEWLLRDRVFYLHTPEGFYGSKLAAKAERALGVPMTARNWRSVSKIVEMLDSD